MRNLIYIILILAVIAGVIYVLFYFLNPAAQNSPLNTLSSAQTPSQLPANYTIADTFPKTETISIGTGSGAIEVKNFYKNIVDTEEGFVILKDEIDYQISYDKSTSKFYIDIRTETAQQAKAESELLNILGVGQQDACKLKVSVFQP